MVVVISAKGGKITEIVQMASRAMGPCIKASITSPRFNTMNYKMNADSNPAIDIPEAFTTALSSLYSTPNLVLISSI